MYNLGMVMISGGRRPSMFSGGVTEGFRGAPYAMGVPEYALGQTPEEWYARAKSAVSDFDSYAARTAKIANKAERERVAKDFGLTNPSDSDKAEYRRNDVQETVRQVESYSPPNYLIYSVGQRARNKVQALENWNKDFRRAVTEAENTYGILPEPQVIERIVEVPGAPGAAPAVNWTLPVVIGGGAIIVAALLGVFGGGGK